VACLEAACTLIGKVDALMMMGRYAEALAVAQARRTARARAARDDHRRVARLDTDLGNLVHRKRPHSPPAFMPEGNADAVGTCAARRA
jgi:hypothetical protein